MVLLDDPAAVGTAHFDNRSFRLNSGITMAIESPEFTRQVEAMLTTELSQARLMAAVQ